MQDRNANRLAPHPNACTSFCIPDMNSRQSSKHQLPCAGFKSLSKFESSQSFELIRTNCDLNPLFPTKADPKLSAKWNGQQRRHSRAA